ncbi:hypothetical protein LTR64_006363 [Lithohypha guttulata]|uniref:uncharacterized protein n=1 Tax=Lithohypha guttulata TaxID=1690604 RepID=UPI002DDF163E|nr:hypothetical protein LTR51_001840 [Lithohypha guttulata]
MERKNRPTSIGKPPHLPQPTVNLSNNVVTATLPTGESAQVHLFGATVTSWKTSDGKERLFLSTAADLTGKKPIRGGVPIVFPVFGPPPKDHETSQLPQHGFARNNTWEFMGKSSSESTDSKSDDSVKLDFGLSSSMLSEDTKNKWPYEFGLVYSVTLSKSTLKVQLQVQNKGEKPFDFQCLFHTYFTVNDISQTTVSGLEGTQYIDKVQKAQTFTEKHDALPIEGETDRVYTTPALPPIVVKEGGKETLVITRDSLPDVTVWNGWVDKIAGMGDFEPKDGWKRYLCIEPGSVSSWTKLEAGEAWEGSTVAEAKL